MEKYTLFIADATLSKDIEFYTFDEYVANNPDSDLSEDNLAMWKSVENHNGWEIEVHARNWSDFSRGIACSEILVRQDDNYYVIDYATLEETISLIDNMISNMH